MFEKIALNQFKTYLCLNSILYKYQAGFHYSCPTDTALKILSDKIKLSTRGIQEYRIGFNDLQKAFDTVDHDILRL